MILVFLQACLGLLMLYFGGEWLVRGASAVALRLGLSPLAVGLTVVAFGTSAPELAVSIDAALTEATDISVGNVVGSNIANIGLILGLACLLRPAMVQASVVRIDAPIMTAACLALVVVLVDASITRLEGIVLLTALVGYVVFTLRQARRETPAVIDEFVAAVPSVSGRNRLTAALLGGGLALLVAGGHALVAAAVVFAEALGVSEATIGLTIVAIGTSLPELSTSIIASLRGQADMAVGNVVGSNIFNSLGILGVTATVHPLQAGGITWIDLGVMIAFAVILSTLMMADRVIDRRESTLALAAFAGYMIWQIVS